MKRRALLAAVGGAAAMPKRAGGAADPASRLVPPEKGHIPVAFVISDGATVIDFAGPWEVYQDVHVSGRGPTHDEQMPFRLYTVAGGPERVRASGGMQIVPDHTVDDAPPPRVVVVPAHRSSPRLLEWIRRVSAGADLTMSVCTGAFALARAGLLAGRRATTHHDYLDRLARDFPDVRVERDRRFVEDGPVATAAGLTSGIDLALRVVERYFGRAIAQATADYLEHQGTGWRPQ